MSHTEWMDALPEEIFLHILTFLGEPDLWVCSKVSIKWRRFTGDPYLVALYAARKVKRGEDPVKVFLECCFKGMTESIGYLIKFFVTEPPKGGYLCLWNRGFLEAAKGGHINLMKKMVSYGITDNLAEEALHHVKNNQKAVQLLLDNFQFRDGKIQLFIVSFMLRSVKFVIPVI